MRNGGRTTTTSRASLWPRSERASVTDSNRCVLRVVDLVINDHCYHCYCCCYYYHRYCRDYCYTALERRGSSSPRRRELFDGSRGMDRGLHNNRFVIVFLFYFEIIFVRKKKEKKNRDQFFSFSSLISLQTISLQIYIYMYTEYARLGDRWFPSESRRRAGLFETCRNRVGGNNVQGVPPRLSRTITFFFQSIHFKHFRVNDSFLRDKIIFNIFLPAGFLRF